MTHHNLFYYPYSSFTNAQLPFLKVAALYFDKLVLLDPVGASWDTIGADFHVRDAMRLLVDAGIVEIVTPATVLAKYEAAITDAIRQDMGDREFLKLCESHSRIIGKQLWRLSLEKVPQDLKTDQTMRDLMGTFARDIANETAYREGYEGDVTYRYADFPLALGEAIMLNHALFAGLLHAEAMPITDDQFHHDAFSVKLRRASQDPVLQKVLEDRAHQLTADNLATTAFNDPKLNLPALNPVLPLEAVLEYRQEHDADLRQARDKLGKMASRISAEPWSKEFAKELKHKTIPDIVDELDEARKARDAWLAGKRGRLVLSASGITVGAAAAVLSVFAAPLTPLALAIAGLSVVSGTIIPGVEWLMDWRDGKKSSQENGLHYLLRL